MSAEKITLEEILRRGYPADACMHRRPDDGRRAVWALWACRTAVRGGHLEAGPEGHVARIWYHACRHRMCPQWAWIPVERWRARQRRRLWAWEHDQVIFTMPHERNERWRANGAVMTPLLFACGHGTWCALFGDAKYLEARRGVIATRQTWRQTLLLHPHLHGLGTGGGLTDAGHWVAVSTGVLLPMRVVVAVFRGQLRAAIRQGVPHGQLRPPEGKTRQQVEKLLNKLGRTKWNVHSRARYAWGQGGRI